MRFFIVRHGEPEDGGDYEVDDDPDLTKEGRKTVEALGEWMLSKDEVPSIIYASPLSRTQETADILKDCFGSAAVKTDVSIGPHASLRGLILKCAADKSMTRVMIVSHHESIANGLRELNGDPFRHLDQMAEGELRIIKVDRDDGTWEEHRRMLPSDLNYTDHY